VFARVKRVFFGPMRVSAMMDSNGSNTTAAAALVAARKHALLDGATAVVLAATGPVGRRAAELLALEEASVRVGSRSIDRARDLAQRTAADTGKSVEPFGSGDETSLKKGCEGAVVLIAAGAAGVQLLRQSLREGIESLKTAIDLNAVPPAGLEGIDVMDK